MASIIKTNVMRILDKAGVEYIAHSLPIKEAVSGTEAAQMLGVSDQRVFKTLVAVGKTGQNYVFVIPVAQELDLKKAARAVGEKSIEMLRAAKLLPTTGYVHGGCSPIGMKKQFVTVMHESFEQQESVIFSAGKIGFHVELSPGGLRKVIDYKTEDIVV